MADVLILTGRGDPRWMWRPIVSALPQHRVCVADRMTHSSFPSLAREVAVISRHVRRHDFDAPIIVAHSVAAFAAEAYARLCPVSALILVNPECEFQVKLRPLLASGANRRVFAAVRGIGSFLDSSRAGFVIGPALWRGDVWRSARRRPSTAVSAAASTAYRGGHAVVAVIAERLAQSEFAADLGRLRRRTSPPEAPVCVLSTSFRARPNQVETDLILVHRQLARSFPRGRHHVVTRSKHMLHLDRPGVIVDAIAAFTPPDITSAPVSQEAKTTRSRRTERALRIL
ncbi:MAG TPA: alpha/beta fold hydrolase [Candidatus Stackebrandtia faecavium]|nr:alpha/beta fold hydrolase [Candidatus Stackebrandtia faecavium]